MPEVLDFYNLVAQKLAAEAQMAAQWIGDRHWATVGASREAALRRFIRSCLPDRLVCGTGFILGAAGELSRQCDLLVYERDVLAPLFVEDDFVVVRADAVRLVIEAKSQVDAGVFRTALNNIRSAKRLHEGIRGDVFGLSGPTDPQVLKGWLDSVSQFGVPGPEPDRDQNAELAAEHLVDFVHFASGLQMLARPSGQEGKARVGARRFEAHSGEALLCFWDWVLRQCAPQPLEAMQTEPIPGLREYLGMEEPEWPDLMTYESTYCA